MSDLLSVASDKAICFVIFGASGDLAMRMLVPSLQTIGCYKSLHEDTTILGVARSSFTDEEIKSKLAEGIHQYARIRPDTSEMCETIQHFLERFKYICGSYDKPETYEELKQEIMKKKFHGVVYYMATPPTLFPIVATKLKEAGLNKLPDMWARLVIEKPFGYDLASSRELTETLTENFDEDSIYRIDHYLAKETVLNIFTFRWGNGIWEPLWNRNYVSHVEIVVSESVDVGNRMGYYEKATVLRDMVQNHLLQILAITAMEAPPIFNAKFIRDEKTKVLESIRPISHQDVIYGQYHGFGNHDGTSGESTAPTFAIIRMYIDNWRWQGVPFFIITGKALKKKLSTIKLVFKEVPHHVFGPNTINSPNVLKIRIQPNEGILLKLHVKMPGMGLDTKQIYLRFNYSDEFGENALQGAYERVILDTFRGDQSFFPRSDEIDISWKIVEPLLQGPHNSIVYAKGMDVRYGTLKRGFQAPAHLNWFYDNNEFHKSTTQTIKRVIIESILIKGSCKIAVSVGTTTLNIFKDLAQTEFQHMIDYSKVHFFMADEKNTTNDDAVSDFSLLKEAFFDPAHIMEENIHRIRDDIDPNEAAREYSEDLLNTFGGDPDFDLIILHMGGDGHIASLYPGTAAVHDRENLIVNQWVPQTNSNRITITPKVINKSNMVLVVLADPRKRCVLESVIHGPYCPGILPAQILRRQKPKVEWNIFA